MMPDPLFYKLLRVGLGWLCLVVHLRWSDNRAPVPHAPPLPAKSPGKRSQTPKPCAGLTHKPHCALCEQERAYPKAPPALRPESRCFPPTAARVRSRPPGTFVPRQTARIKAGWGEATCVPTAIPVAARGGNATVPPAKAPFWKRTAPAFMVSGSRSHSSCVYWRAGLRA
jgi:hypothetical protein